MKKMMIGCLAAVLLLLTSCEKDCDKDKFCDISDCYVCEKKWDKGDKDGYIWDEEGNKIAISSIGHDTRGKYFTHDNGQRYYFENDQDGAYYVDDNGNQIYIRKKELLGKEIEKIVLEPLEYDEECGYIIKGKVKVLVEGKTKAIIDYGDGTVDAWAVKTMYFYKDCDKDKKGWGKGDKRKGKKFTKCCKFEQKCKKEVDTSINTDTQINH